MNKNDIKLIIILLIISILFILCFNLSQKQGTFASVYYENNLILKIDLNIDKEYSVKGYNGNVKLKVKNKKIKVIEEKSPLHLCSKQGYISSSNETIVCLPNKIVIKIEDDNNIDTIVR